MSDPVVLRDLLSGGWANLQFQPFRDGVEIASFLEGSPAIALLRYAPGAKVPLHEHIGAEMIIVLDGTQSDERGTFGAGDVVINLPGSRHTVWSDDGCVVLLHWSQPVKFID